MKIQIIIIAIFISVLSSFADAGPLRNRIACDEVHAHLKEHLIVPSSVNDFIELFMLDVSFDSETGECRVEFLYRVNEPKFVEQIIVLGRKKTGKTLTYEQVVNYFNSSHGRNSYIENRERGLLDDPLLSDLKSIHSDVVLEMTYYFSDDTPDSVNNITHVMR